MRERVPGTRSLASALALIGALVCLVAGLASGRPDTAALATPFALLALAGRAPAQRRWAADDAGITRITVDHHARTTRTDGHVRLLLTPADHRTMAAHGREHRLTATTFSAPGHPAAALVLRDDEECPLSVDTQLSGEHDLLAYGTAGFGPDLSAPSAFQQAPNVRISMLPRVDTAPAGPVSPRLTGLTGSHVSRRPGGGGELRSVAPWQSGDPLRRIDWRSTARRSTDQDRLMVRRSFADAEASVFLVVDSAHDVPDATGEWFSDGMQRPAASSLHTVRTAATTVAASYLSAGDRVGLMDLAGTHRDVRTAGGARHLEQIRARLACVSVVPGRHRRRRDPVPPSGAVVVLLSAFLDDEAGRLLRLWHAQGLAVVGIDCLPPLRRSETSSAQRLAVRLTLLRRTLELEDLRRSGIAVLATGEPSTGGAPDLATGLRLLERDARRRAGQRPGRSTARRFR